MRARRLGLSAGVCWLWVPSSFPIHITVLLMFVLFPLQDTSWHGLLWAVRWTLRKWNHHRTDLFVGGDMAASEVKSDHTINLNYGTHHNRDKRKSERNVACHWSCLRQPQHQNQTYRSLMKGSFLSQSFSTVAGEFFFIFSKGRSIGSQNVGKPFRCYWISGILQIHLFKSGNHIFTACFAVLRQRYQ